MQYYNETWDVWLTHAVFADCSKAIGSTEIMVTIDRIRRDVKMRTLVDSPCVKPKQKIQCKVSQCSDQ
jgi:hypothetical protein